MSTRIWSLTSTCISLLSCGAAAFSPWQELNREGCCEPYCYVMLEYDSKVDIFRWERKLWCVAQWHVQKRIVVRCSTIYIWVYKEITCESWRIGSEWTEVGNPRVKIWDQFCEDRTESTHVRCQMGHGYLAKGVLLLVLVLSCMLQIVHSTFGTTQSGQLVKSYYDASCPKAEQIVRTIVTKAVKKDPRAAASLLRLFFHDCFVSVLRFSALILLSNSSSLQYQ